jgi:glycosyltransferase involved in cell wall biosynthesis
VKRTASRAILVVAHRFSLGFGGVPESILLLANGLEPAGVRVDVVCRDGILNDVGRLSGLPAGGRSPSLGEVLRLDLSAYRSVFVAGAWNPVALIFGIRARLAGVRLVYSPKGNLAIAEFKRPRDIKKFPYLLSVELLLLLLSQRIVFSSRLERDNFILRPFFTRSAAIIPEPFSGPDVSEPPGPSAVLRFGFLAEIAPRKGLLELVRAFLTWQGAGETSVELHIAGEPRPGSERYCQSIHQLIEASDQAKIIWRGPLRGSARDGFYQTIDFLVCPTKFESFGLTPLEALWQGKPVMVTANMGVLEFIADQSSIITLKDCSKSELLRGLRDAKAMTQEFAAAAGKWRLRPQPGLTGAELISRFLVVLGFEDEVVVGGGDFLSGAGD